MKNGILFQALLNPGFTNGMKSFFSQEKSAAFSDSWRKGFCVFFVEHDGNEVTKFFTIAPYCFTSAFSFRNQAPATESIQALENCVAYTISLKNADLLLELKHWAIFTRKFTQQVQYQTEQLMMEAKTTPAAERYRLLLENYPGIVQRIPLKHLSGFLGIAPQSLSRIRKNYIRDLRK